MFDKNYMSGLPKNRILAAYQICSDLFEKVGTTSILGADVPRIAKLTDEEVKDALLILEELLRDDLPYDKMQFNKPGSMISAIIRSSRDSRILRIQNIHRQLKVRLLVLHVDEKNILEHKLLVFFQQDDIRRVNDLLSEIRDLVKDNVDLAPDHKRRLFKIASEFQAELDKPKSDFRVFLDGLVEASEALGQAGKKAKPAFDRFREIFNIAEKRFSKNPQIEGPSEPKRLPAPETPDNINANAE